MGTDRLALPAAWGRLRAAEKRALAQELAANPALVAEAARIVATGRQVGPVMEALHLALQLAPLPAAKDGTLDDALLSAARQETYPQGRCDALDELEGIENRVRDKIAVLLPALVAQQEQVRLAACSAFGSLGRPAVAPLLRVLKDKWYWERQAIWNAVMALDHAVGDDLGEPAIAKVAAVLRDLALTYDGPEEPVVWKAVESLGPLHLLGDPRPHYRRQAIAALTRLATAESEFASSLALEYLSESGDRLAGEALEELAGQPGPRQVPAAAALVHWHARMG